MASATKTATVYAPASSTYPWKITAEFTENSSNTSTNKSNITVTGKLYGKNINFASSNAHMYVYWIDNNKHTTPLLVADKVFTSTAIGSTYTVTGTIDVEHKDDGKLNGYARVFWDKSSGSYVPPDTTVNTDNTALTTIARKTIAKDIFATVGVQYNLSVLYKSESFTHTATYSIGGRTGSITFSTNNIAYWTPDVNLMNVIPGSYLEGTYNLKTYDGGTLIGDSTAKLTLYANKTLASPTVSATMTLDATTNALTGVTNKMIKGFSTATITPTITTKYGATVSSKTVNSVPFTTTAYSVKGVTTNVFKVDVTDSRGFTGTGSVSGTIIDYVRLGLTSLNAERQEVTSSTINITGSLNYWNSNFGAKANTLSCKVRYKQSDSSTWSSYVTIPYTLITGGAKFTVTLNNLDYRNSWNLDFLFEDEAMQVHDTGFIPKGIEAFAIGDNFIATPHIYLINETTGEYTLYI